MDFIHQEGSTQFSSESRPGAEFIEKEVVSLISLLFKEVSSKGNGEAFAAFASRRG